MTNRFATVALITLVSFLGGVILFVIGLFMFPGVRLFGIRYVSLNGRAVQTIGEDGSSRVKINDKVEGFSGVIINCQEVPVYVQFTDDRYYEIEYLDNFNGLTSSDIEYPSISYSKDKDGNAVITISEFKTFIYESSTSVRYLKLYIPLRDVVDDTEHQYVRDIKINSNKSKVSFSKVDDSRVPRLNTVSVKTNGSVKYETKILANNYEFETNNSILVSADIQTGVDAKNYKLSSSNGGITIEKDNIGNLEATTVTGDIKFRSCNSLTVNTKYGNVGYAFLKDEDKEGKYANVDGVALINAKLGDVVLGKILGGGVDNEITTSSGKIIINQLYDGKIKTSGGRIEIKHARKLDVYTNVGKVYIEEITSSLNVETARSNVYLGGENKIMNNVRAFSRLGNIYMYSASEKVDIETLSGNIEFVNLTSKNISIKCGGLLKAESLMGLVNIKAEKNVELSFTDVSLDNTNIELGKGCTSAIIDALNNTQNEVNYFITGKQVLINANQNNNRVPLKDSTDYKVSNSNTIVQFKVTAPNTIVDVCFKNDAVTE